MQIRTPDSGSCLMYEEVQSQDLRNSGGVFSLTINDGTGSRTDSTGLTLDRIFANRGTFTLNPASCNAGPGTFAPGPNDGRDLVVLFKDETMASWEPIPAQKINFVPFAFEAKQIAGFTADSLLRVVNGSGDPLTGLAPLSNAQYNALLDLLNGTSAQYTKAGQLNGVALPTMSAGEVLGWNGTSWVSTTSTPGANSVTTTMIQNGAVDGTKLDPAISISTSGTVASAITTTRDFKIYAPAPSTFYVGMLADPTLAASYTLTWPLTKGTNGQVLTSDGAGKLTWTSPSSAGITDLTGDVTATGPGSAAATVVSVGGSAAADVHTAELAANAATSLNTPNTIVKRDGSGGFAAGAVSATSVASSGTVTATGAISGASVAATGAVTAVTVTASGAVTQGSSVFKDSGSNTVTVQAPTTVSSSYVLKWPTSAGGSGDVLTTDASGNLSWITPSGAPTGSAGGDLTGSYPNPTVATVGTSTAANIHSAELLANAATAANTPNTIVKRDGSGNFTAGDITASNVKTDTLQLNNAGSVVNVVNPLGAAYTLTLPTGTGTSGQVLTTDGSGITSWTTVSSSGGDFMKDGSVAMTGTLKAVAGTAAAPGVTFVGDLDTGLFAPAADTVAVSTNGSEKLRIASNGRVGIGTTAPGYRLHVPWISGDSVSTAFFGGSGSTQVAVEALSQYSNAILGTTYDTTASNGGVKGVSYGTAAGLSGSNWSSGYGLYAASEDGSAGYFTTTNSTASNTNPILIAKAGSSQTANTSVIEARNGAGTAIFKVAAGGNVGIGTTAPAAALDVVRSTGANIRAKVTTAGSASVISAENESGKALSLLMYSPSIGGGGAVQPDGAWLGANGAGGLSISSFNASAPMRFYTGGIGDPQERVRITSTGNVGIGTTSPGYKLDVAGAINATALKINGVDVSAGGSPGGATTQVQFNDSGAFAGDSDFIWDKTNKRLGVKTAAPSAALSVEEGNTAGIIGGRAYIGGWTGGASEGVFANGNMNAWNTTNYAIRQNDVGRTVVNSANGYELQFAIENDEKMRVAADGKIGIGTTSPNGQLDVQGSIVMSGATSGYAGFQPAASAGSTIWTLPAADGTSGQVLSTDGAGVLSWVSSGGGGDFKADGSVTMTGVFKASNGTAAAPSITFGSNTNTGMYRVASNKIGFSTGGANRMVINNTGVGIGTTNPGAPLDVNGLINTAEGLMVGGYGALENTDDTLKINYTSGAFNVAIYPGGYNPAAIWIRNPTGEVGIGTTSPNGKLDVKGSLVLSGATSGYTGFQPAAAAGSTVWTLPSADGTSGQVLKTDGSGTLSWVSVSDTLSGLSCSSGQVPSWNGSAWVCVSTSVSNSNNTLVLRDGSGNVGANVVTANGLSLSNGASSTITLTTPAAFTSYALQLPSTYGTNGQVLTSDGAGNASWTAPGGGSLWTAHSPNISYDGGGNVGIGTTAPSSLLQVRQDAAGQTDTNITNKSNSASAMASVTLTNDAGDIGGLFSPSSAYTLSHMRNRLSLQSLSAATGIDIAAGGGTADVRIYAGGAMTAQERMRVTANGDVGIGTTSPNVKLHVSDSANTYLRLESTGGSSGIYANYASGSAGGLYFWGASILRGGVFADTDHSVVLKTQNSTPLRFLTGNVEKMRITASGNVGIGTTSPNYNLDVVGDVNVTGNFKVNGVNLSTGGGDFKKDGSVAMTGDLQLNRYINGGNTGNVIDTGTSAGNNFDLRTADADLRLRTINNNSIMLITNATERMRVTQTGNVGIGTTSPTSTLQIGSGQIRVPNGSNTAPSYAFTNATTSGLYYDFGVSGIKFAISGSDQWYMSANEFASTPLYSPALRSNPGSTGATAAYGFNADQNTGMFSPASDTIGFTTNGSEKMRIDSSGNVGIGTTSPTQMLEVNGTVLASAYLYSSDRRLKKDITPLEQSLEKLLTLNTVKFNWIEPKNKDEERTQIGLIAQDVQKVFPEAVKEDSQGWLRMNYQALISPIIDGMREMYHKLMNVDAKTDALQARVNDLEAKNKALEERLNKIEATLQKASTQPERAPAGH